jgi:hypothetical protein
VEFTVLDPSRDALDTERILIDGRTRRPVRVIDSQSEVDIFVYRLPPPHCAWTAMEQITDGDGRTSVWECTYEAMEAFLESPQGQSVLEDLPEMTP